MTLFLEQVLKNGLTTVTITVIMMVNHMVLITLYNGRKKPLFFENGIRP